MTGWERDALCMQQLIQTPPDVCYSPNDLTVPRCDASWSPDTAQTLQRCVLGSWRGNQHALSHMHRELLLLGGTFPFRSPNGRGKV